MNTVTPTTTNAEASQASSQARRVRFDTHAKAGSVQEAITVNSSQSVQISDLGCSMPLILPQAYLDHTARFLNRNATGLLTSQQKFVDVCRELEQVKGQLLEKCKEVKALDAKCSKLQLSIETLLDGTGSKCSQGKCSSVTPPAKSEEPENQLIVLTINNRNGTPTVSSMQPTNDFIEGVNIPKQPPAPTKESKWKWTRPNDRQPSVHERYIVKGFNPPRNFERGARLLGRPIRLMRALGRGTRTWPKRARNS